jgi:hypothetical protein
MSNILKNTGISAPLQQTDCFQHNDWWLSYWKNCENGINTEGKDAYQIKKIKADKCCSNMVCRGRDEWLIKNNLYSCTHTDPKEPSGFGAGPGWKANIKSEKLKSVSIGIY